MKDNANGRQVVVAWKRNVRQRTETSGIYEVPKKKPARRLFYMLWMPLLKVLPNSLCIESESDVLVLALRRYPDLCSNSCFVTGTGSSRRVINLKSVADALGPTKTAALALTGADFTGSFSGKGKATLWDEFHNASTPILQALANFGCGEQPDDGTRSGVEQLVCRM